MNIRAKLGPQAEKCSAEALPIPAEVPYRSQLQIHHDATANEYVILLNVHKDEFALEARIDSV